MKNKIAAAFIYSLTLSLLAITFNGCTGSSGGFQSDAQIVEGTAAASGIYFAPSAPENGEAVLMNESLTVSTEEGTYVTSTDQTGKFRLQLRKRDGTCSIDGGNGGGQKKRYGGGGRMGNGQKVAWNFVDNNGDGVCDNTLEVSIK